MKVTKRVRKPLDSEWVLYVSGSFGKASNSCSGVCTISSIFSMKDEGDWDLSRVIVSDMMVPGLVAGYVLVGGQADGGRKEEEMKTDLSQGQGDESDGAPESAVVEHSARRNIQSDRLKRLTCPIPPREHVAQQTLAGDGHGGRGVSPRLFTRDIDEQNDRRWLLDL